MALTPSTMPPLGMPLPDATLADGRGTPYTLSALAGQHGLLVAFICNHCPYVQHLNGQLAPLGTILAEEGVGMVAISSNDPQAYPADAPAEMALQAEGLGYSFPYLFDATQDVARAFHAACTPDFFLFDSRLQLFYRGQFDASRPGKGKPDGADLLGAVAALVAGEGAPAVQQPGIGCNIKWRED
ncbi:thioredoxin family protein [Chitinilyticum piscinae]|uniref:Thioredoxin family protein n=1 Tax=Chitinilyticum piscinae TaxID=2866724 RepID=A0A8J7FYE1_9NEIS|nr:thioredoxin family protein [Chitinilyticum piscinae]MBE9607988.1 thioredoxin family protein [Chitinilyticum piscinae]